MSDSYRVPFQGETIEAATGLDAVDLKLADQILNGGQSAGPVEVERLARVLDRYDRSFAAHRLRREQTRELIGR